jgi:hypothetical protein
MAGAVIEIARERDQALARLQALAAEIRAHEQVMRRSIASPRRPADETLYRRLRHVNGGSDRVGTGGTRPIGWRPSRAPDGADAIRKGPGPWA